MKLNLKNNNNNKIHLTYCTNIHKGKNWEEIFKNLKKYPNFLRKNITKKKNFSIGLCLSHKNITQLKNSYDTFKIWLKKKYFYIQTINGFCYSTFHKKNIKHTIYYPYWNTNLRYFFTKSLTQILSDLTTKKISTISTIPLFYKKLVETKKIKYYVLQQSVINLMKIIIFNYNIYLNTNKHIYICLEPEPDCFLEKTEDIITFYKSYLQKYGIEYLKKNFNIKKIKAFYLIKNYIQICYDICHFALFTQQPHKIFYKLKKNLIKIGKVQASVCLKTLEPRSIYLKKKFLKNIKKTLYNSQFLHQVQIKNIITKKKTKSSDLKNIFKNNENIHKKNSYDNNIQQYTIHFHIPLYRKNYQKFKTTDYLVTQVIENISLTDTTVIEIETYTWDNIKDSQKLNIIESLTKEYLTILKKQQNEY